MEVTIFDDGNEKDATDKDEYTEREEVSVEPITVYKEFIRPEWLTIDIDGLEDVGKCYR